MREIEIESLYHKFTGEQQGAESNPTLYFQRNLDRPYHIDYIFAALRFSNKLKQMEIGQVNTWLEISDHMPIMCEIDYQITKNETPKLAIAKAG